MEYSSSGIPIIWNVNNIFNGSYTEFNPTLEFTPQGYVTFTASEDNSGIGLLRKSTN